MLKTDASKNLNIDVIVREDCLDRKNNYKQDITGTPPIILIASYCRFWIAAMPHVVFKKKQLRKKAQAKKIEIVMENQNNLV